jgi:zinc and cadmium transporter
MTQSLIIYSILAIVLTLLGGIIPLVKKLKHDHLHYFVNFSAGVLLATGFLHILPDAVERIDAHFASILMLGSFTAFYILEKFIMIHPCEETHCNYHHLGIAAFVGMTIHTLFDGVSLGASLFVDGLDEIVFLAIMSHKIPASFSLASILKVTEVSKTKIILALIIFGAFVPLGAIFSKTIINYYLSDQIIGIMLSVSLGAIIYIATSDFLPEVHRDNKGKFFHLLSFLSGIVLMIIIMNTFPSLH